MTRQFEVYKCMHCGNIVEVVHGGGDHTAGDRTRGTDAAARQLHAGGHPLSVAANCLTNPGDPLCKTKECGVTGAHHESAQA